MTHEFNPYIIDINTAIDDTIRVQRPPAEWERSFSSRAPLLYVQYGSITPIAHYGLHGIPIASLQKRKEESV